MARTLLIAAAAVALFAKASVAAYAEEEDVLVLTEDTFDAAVKEFNPLLVEFYAPWCGHCKKLAPEYAKAAGALKADGLRIAKVDATEEKDLATRFEIQGFPTLKFFRGSVDSASDYNGGRDADSIAQWVRKKSGPATKDIATAEDAAAFAAASEVVVLGFFAPGSAGATAFNGVAASVDDVPFGLSNSDEVRAAYGVDAGAEGIVAVNKFPKQANTVKYAGDVTSTEAISAWVQANSLPLVVAFTPENVPKIFRGALKTHFLLFADPEAEGYEALVEEFRGVAAQGEGACLFVTVAPDQDRVLQYFGVTKADMPGAAMVTMPEGGAMKKFMFDKSGGINGEALAAFLGQYKAGALKAHLKSEEVPEADASAPVRIAVGKNFESAVINGPEELQVVEFYAPWCGHCKSLAPVYDEVGLAYKGVPSVGIWKIDATANEVEYPGVNVRGFPTILGFVKTAEGGRKVVEFDGSRDVEGFKAFIAKHAPGAAAAAAGGASEDDLEL